MNWRSHFRLCGVLVAIDCSLVDIGLLIPGIDDYSTYIPRRTATIISSSLIVL